MPTIRVVAHIKAQPDQAEKLKGLLTAQVAPTRSEDGCISYVLMQNNSDPADFVFVEEWRDLNALKAHIKSPHIQQGREARAALLGGEPDIRLYTQIA
ncbi:MAG: antibiotic biosynthesis monooxygenase [Desulfarculus sp.]|jgi:quinol monooxygenase YgiN|nr:MAG: antibiotic biosynthesis monooxygenase [Desulfarculus sp.]